jgi:hypothetical protein
VKPETAEFEVRARSFLALLVLSGGSVGGPALRSKGFLRHDFFNSLQAQSFAPGWKAPALQAAGVGSTLGNTFAT